MNLLCLYDEDISVRFPAHYREVLLKLLPAYGLPTLTFCFDSRTSKVCKVSDNLISIPKIRPRNLLDIFREYFITKKNLSNAIQEHLVFRPDFVLAFNHPILIKFGYELSKKYRSQFLVHIGHLMAEELIGSQQLTHQLRGTAAFINRYLSLKKADRLLVISPEMKNYFTKFRSPAIHKIYTWNSGVEVNQKPEFYSNKAQQLKKSLGLDNCNLLIYIGNMSKYRKLTFLIDVMDRIIYRQKIEKVKMIFIGYAVNKQDIKILEDYSAKKKLSRWILFHPPVPETELPYYIKMADIGLCPTPDTMVLKQCSPVKILEYFKVGLPAVATNIPDLRLMIQQSQGGYCAKWNIYDYAATVIKLLKLSKEKRLEMGLNGFRWISSQRSVDVLTKNLYRDVFLQEK